MSTFYACVAQKKFSDMLQSRRTGMREISESALNLETYYILKQLPVFFLRFQIAVKISHPVFKSELSILVSLICFTYWFFVNMGNSPVFVTSLVQKSYTEGQALLSNYRFRLLILKIFKPFNS